MLTDYTSTKLMRKLVDGLQYLHQCCLIHANLTVREGGRGREEREGGRGILLGNLRLRAFPN